MLSTFQPPLSWPQSCMKATLPGMLPMAMLSMA
jgi:hypothetical protein